MSVHVTVDTYTFPSFSDEGVPESDVRYTTSYTEAQACSVDLTVFAYTSSLLFRVGLKRSLADPSGL